MYKFQKWGLPSFRRASFIEHYLAIGSVDEGFDQVFSLEFKALMRVISGYFHFKRFYSTLGYITCRGIDKYFAHLRTCAIEIGCRMVSA